ncbi:Na+-transporting malonate decarboxylase, carboxybiotin decarboxylase subunit, madB [Ligilactobacillus faecis]
MVKKMEMLFIVLHVLFGLGAFAGSLLLAISFKDKFHELSKLQRTALLVTIGSLFATLVVTMAARGNVIFALFFSFLAVGACGYLAFTKPKKA